MFSTVGIQPMTLTLAFMRASAVTAAMTAAAPLMSHFIVSMAFGGLSERPPESKVTPLPTRATVFLAPLGEYSRRMSRGGLAEPCPTARIPPNSSRARASSSQTSTRTGSLRTDSMACWAISSGGSADGGVLTRSRA